MPSSTAGRCRRVIPDPCRSPPRLWWLTIRTARLLSRSLAPRRPGPTRHRTGAERPASRPSYGVLASCRQSLQQQPATARGLSLVLARRLSPVIRCLRVLPAQPLRKPAQVSADEVDQGHDVVWHEVPSPTLL